MLFGSAGGRSSMVGYWCAMVASPSYLKSGVAVNVVVSLVDDGFTRGS